MNLDFSFNQHMRMSSVKRWVIIEMSRAQSVAEHSFNVAVIANGLLSKMAVDVCFHMNDILHIDANINLVRADVLEWALMHDLPEVLTGDIPTPVKKHLRDSIDGMEDTIFPGYGNMRKRFEGTIVEVIVKLADDIDAIQFAERFCIDPKKISILLEMEEKLAGRIAEAEKKYGFPVRQAVEAVWHD